MYPMLRRISILAVVLLLVAAVSLAQTAEIPLEDLPMLENDSALQDSFDEEVTAQLYAFQGSAGDVVSLAMTQLDEDGELDPYLLLFAQDGTLLAADDDSGAVFLSALIDGVELPDDGTYFVLATSLFYLDSTAPDVPEPQGYIVSLQGATPATDADDAQSAQIEAVPLGYGDSVSADSTLEMPSTFFAFAGEAGETVRIVMDSDEFPTLVHLFDPTGARVAVDASAIGVEALEESGVYLILAGDAFFYEALLEDGFFLGGSFALALDGE